jgi:competence protein ComEC
MSDVGDATFRNDVFGAIDKFRDDNVGRITRIGGDGAALLGGMLLGNTEALAAAEVNQAFRICGLSHLIAVSGSHLAVIATLLAWFLSKLPVGKPVEYGALVAVLVVYVILTGLQPSAIRAAIMCGVSGMAYFAGRRGHGPTALAAAAVIMLLATPSNAFSIGFWLSVFAVLGLVLFSPIVKSWFTEALSSAAERFGKPAGKAKQVMSESLALTATAQLATIPIIVPVFSMFSCVSPIANIVVAPLATVMVGAGMVALIITLLPLPFCEQIGTFVLYALSKTGDVAGWVAGLLGKVPFSAVPLTADMLLAIIIALIIASLLFITWPRLRASTIRVLGAVALSAALVFTIVLPNFTPPQLVVMDIGQGDALLVREGGNNVLVDTGENTGVLLQALARQHITQLNAVVISHLDSDHCGALEALRGTVNVRNIYFAKGLLTSKGTHNAMRTAYALVGDDGVGELSAGDSIKVGKTLRLDVVWPIEPVSKGDNPDSVCMLLSYDADADGAPEKRTLLTGDAEAPEVAKMMDARLLPRVDVLKLGHHGSTDDIRLEQLRELGVTCGLISAGVNNRYGHPTASTLDILERGDVHVFRTDENGDITVHYDGGAARVSCAKIGEA